MDYTTDYIAYKVKVLDQLGLHNSKKVEAYLYKASQGATTETSRNIRIDNAARQLLVDFYDGDKTYAY